MDEVRLRTLVETGRSLVAERDLDRLLNRIVDAARKVTGARYAALGVLDEERRTLAQFHTAGVDQETHERIGEPPRGRGLLGVLVKDPRPLRLSNLREHAHSFGFPAEPRNLDAENYGDSRRGRTGRRRRVARGNRAFSEKRWFTTATRRRLSGALAGAAA